MGRLGWIARGIAATIALGCGEIVEVPVATSTESTRGDTSEGEGPSTAGPSPTADSGATSDIDPPSGSGGGGESTTGAGEPVPQPFCAVLRDEISIPENGRVVEVAIEVPALEGVTDLVVSLRLVHTRVSDLQVTLLDPGGGSTRLLDHPACEGANIDAFFHDDAAQLGNDQCLLAEVSAIMGQVQPVDPLEGLLHASLAGTWTLTVIDDDPEPETQGSLETVCLVLTTGGR